MTGGWQYHELNRAGAVSWWRTIAGSALLLVLFVWVPVIVAIPFMLGLALSGASESAVNDFFDFAPVTPANLAYLDIGLAAAIGSSIAVAWLFHAGQAPRWLFSVLGAIRWRWFGRCVGISVVTLIVTVVVSAVLPSSSAEGVDLAGGVNAFTGQTLAFLAVIVFLTPFQAAGEEFVFRGYLTQAWGGLGSRRSARLGQLAAVGVPALLFAVAHGVGQEAPVFFDRFAFGIVAGVLVIATGGLEAALAMHVVNNLVAFGLGLFFGDMTTALTQTEGSWWLIVATLTQSLLYLALVTRSARRHQISARTTEPDPVRSGR